LAKVYGRQAGQEGPSPVSLPGVPRSWLISMVVLVTCLMASMVIALVKLI
jgi:hypothetical protein